MANNSDMTYARVQGSQERIVQALHKLLNHEYDLTQCLHVIDEVIGDERDSAFYAHYYDVCS